MSGAPLTGPRSLRRARLAGAAPRVALYGLCGVLCAAGLSSIARGHNTINERIVQGARSVDLAAGEFATEFTRAYLTYQSARPAARSEALSQVTNAALDSEAGVSAQGTQTVSWAEPVEEQPQPWGALIVTVAAQTSAAPSPQYLAVPVIRAGNGALAIADDPAFVGPPVVDSGYSPPSQEPVTDSQLTAVVTRVVTNYLSDNPQDLQADLAPGSQVTLPTVAMTVQHVTNVTWGSGHGVIEVDLTARDQSGTTFSLTYFIGVVRRERWYATSISVNPAST
jgi:hypothetical protein